uniref:E2 ubiquitin-conjugating enzyme n=1 Tax=Musa acuminata subsp. malaccensis TaxID=214687 RepID=A0A804HW51_MUSAM|nr:PREDICTED: probable ubiquitin-conjugating enzyme E2 23 [Musa acuminata subsp. malaccensis]
MEVNNGPDAIDSAPNASCFDVASRSKVGKPVETGELNDAQAKDIFVYRQDVVKCCKRDGLLGIVVQVAGDSDSEGSISDDDGSEEDGNKVDESNGGDNGVINNNIEGGDNIGSLQDGQVRVTWSDGSETMENTSDITVVDRSFLHGDIVASATDPTGQLGLIVDVDITVDLLSPNGEVIRNVSSKDLKRIREFSVGDFVVLGPWLGRVDEVLDNVTVLFDDGSVCKVVKADPMRLKPVLKPIVDDADCPYYPGQRVRAVSSSVFKSSRWLSGLWKANRLEGAVIKVQAGSVVVYWIASAYLGVGTNSATVPSEEQNPKNLTLLSCFSHTNWQLADWCLLSSYPQPSTLVDSIPGNSKLKEPGSHYISHVQNNHTSSCILGEGSSTDAPETEDTVDCFHVKSSHAISSDAHDAQCTSEQVTDGLSEGILLDGNCQSQADDYSNHDKTAKLGETNGAESNDLPENCSCSSSSSVSKEPAHESWPAYRKKLRKVFFKRDKKARRRDENFEKALLIVNTVTKVNVAWQNGEKEFGLQSTSLIPIHTPNDHEFFPEQYVIDKASNEGDGASETNRLGVVRSVNSQEQTVCVRWLKPVSRPEDLKEFDHEEVVSAYELDGHPDYDYCYGDVVVRLPPVSDDTTKSEVPTETQEYQRRTQDTADDSSREHKDNSEENQTQNDEICGNFTSLSWVGNIVGLQDGDIEVTWADGMVSKVGPQEIYVVGRDDDDDGLSDDGASWETVDENEMDIFDDTEKEVDPQNPTDNTVQREKSATTSVEDGTGGRSGPLAVPLAALDFVTKLATGLFSRTRKQSDSSGSDQIIANEDGHKADIDLSGSTLDEAYENRGFDVSDGLIEESMDETVEVENQVAATEEAELKIEDSIVKPTLMGLYDGNQRDYSMDDLCNFSHFDVTENPLDHHFHGDAEMSNGGRKWVKKVQQEWTILEKNLPDAIYVRVFEDRMDLIRAVIIGACGTPYQDGLFFFDFQLPPEYPQVPPSVYYHSGGLRVNPNLYVDGKVCLSLLNTWTGKGNEVWDPSSSSILQVLVSLQGLVLNDKPYFNEAGYEKQIGTVEGEKNALPYNENTYLLNLKSMLYLLRRPPVHFEVFVKDQFRRRGHYILKACEAYMDGCLIGSLTKDACLTETSRKHSCSVGFKLTLAKILPRLIPALKEVGADCHQFDYLLKVENLSES